MKFFKYLRVAVESIQAHRMRAILTMLGIMIGIAAVLITVGIGSGSAVSITERIESSGTNLLTVSSGSRGATGSTLTIADAEVLMNQDRFPAMAAVAPTYQSNASVTYGATEGSYTVVGATDAYLAVRGQDLAAGEFLTADQVALKSNVVVLGSTVAGDLFGGQEPVGQSIRIDDALFQVIGVLESTGSSGFGSSDTQLYVPIAVAQGRLFNAARYRGSYTISSISIQAVNQDQLDSAALAVEQVLRLRHGLGTDDDNDFTITNQIVLGGGFWWANRSGLLANSGLGSSSSKLTASGASGSTRPTGTNAGQLPFNPGQGQLAPSQDTVSTTINDGTAMSVPPANPEQSATDASAAMNGTATITQPSSATDIALANGQAATPFDTKGATQGVVSSVVAIVGAKGTLIWQTDGSLLTTLEAGTKLNATEQTADGTWLQVTNGSTAGWVESATLVIFDQNKLAVATLPEAIVGATAQTAAPTTPSEEAAPAQNEFDAQNLMTDSAPASESAEAAIAATTPAVTATVVTTGARLNIRSGPDTTYTIAAKATNGTTLTVLGRDESGAWLEVQLPDDSAATGWIAATYVQLAVPVTEVPASADAI